MSNTNHVCKHTENGQNACFPCSNPFKVLYPENKIGFNKFMSNVSHIIFEADEFDPAIVDILKG